MKIAHWGLGILLVLPAGAAARRQATQQSQSDSLAEAARRTREQKKDQAKPARVWDNDDIPKTNGVSVVGETPAAGTDASANGANPAAAPTTAPGAAANAGTNAAAAGPGAAAGNAATVSAELAAAKDRLKSLQTDLDILQRKNVLDQQMYLSNPQHQTDKAGATQLRDEQDQIDAKRQDVADAQKQVDELQAKLATLAPPPPAPNPN